ncbi:MAG: hypothetical protein AB1606_06060 [Nitrospirota bacterium]
MIWLYYHRPLRGYSTFRFRNCIGAVVAENDKIEIMGEKKNSERRKGKSPVKCKKLGWKGLYGLGKGLWKGEDAQEYVNSLRRDRRLLS